MKDNTILAIAGIAVAGIIITALILKKTDRGTMLLRDAQGNINAILPMDRYFIDQRATQDQATASLLTDNFSEEFLRTNK